MIATWAGRFLASSKVEFLEGILCLYFLRLSPLSFHITSWACTTIFGISINIGLLAERQF